MDVNPPPAPVVAILGNPHGIGIHVLNREAWFRGRTGAGGAAAILAAVQRFGDKSQVCGRSPQPRLGRIVLPVKDRFRNRPVRGNNEVTPSVSVVMIAGGIVVGAFLARAVRGNGEVVTLFHELVASINIHAPRQVVRL